MMKNVILLSDLGSRICILGPSNSGKSTLAEAIGKKLSYPVIHLDQVYHLPNTFWRCRSEHDFLMMHDQLIQDEQWIIDGNYTRYLNMRVEKATGLILLDISLPIMLKRYFYRTLFQHNRVGGVVPKNQKDRISMEMLKYLIFSTHKKRKQYQDIFDHCSIPKIFLASPAQIQACWKNWSLS